VSALCHQKQIFSVTIKCPPDVRGRRLASGSVLRDEELDRPAIMSELFPTKLRCLGIGPCYNLTVAPLWGHRSASHPVARRHRPQQLVLLVRFDWRGCRVRHHAPPAGDKGVGAQMRWATALLASRAQCPLWFITGHVGWIKKRPLYP
jgi:hypothetical protein